MPPDVIENIYLTLGIPNIVNIQLQLMFFTVGFSTCGDAMLQ